MRLTCPPSFCFKCPSFSSNLLKILMIPMKDIIIIIEDKFTMTPAEQNINLLSLLSFENNVNTECVHHF